MSFFQKFHNTTEPRWLGRLLPTDANTLHRRVGNLLPTVLMSIGG